MKKILSIVAVAVVFAACKSNFQSENKNLVLVDTTGLSENDVLTKVGGKYMIKENVVNKTTAIPQKQSNAVKAPAVKDNTVTNYSQVNSNKSAIMPQDKGWSHAAKGTVVGAGTGAITGAIINKEERGKGAIIGSLIGAGAGYLIGRATDKNTGRVDRAKARKAAN